MLKTWLSKSPSNARFIEAAERKKELFEYNKTVETKAKAKMRQALFLLFFFTGFTFPCLPTNIYPTVRPSRSRPRRFSRATDGPPSDRPPSGQRLHRPAVPVAGDLVTFTAHRPASDYNLVVSLH